MNPEPTRRALLARSALTLAGVTALAGCTSDGGDDGTPAPTEPPTDETTATPTEAATSTDGGGSSADHTVAVGPGGSLVFDPAELTVDPGATVEFTWESNFHTVTVESQPDGANWSGTGEETHDSGYTLTHTFEVAGTYEYYCQPHRSSGMEGTVVVGDGGGGGDATTTGGSGGRNDGPY
jgi:plastocyanin